MTKVLAIDVGGTKLSYAIINEQGEFINEVKKISTPKNIEELGKVQPKWRAPKKGAEEVNAIFKRLKEEGKSLSEIKDEINELYSRPKYAHLSRWNKIDEFGIFMDSDLSRTNGPRDYNIINPNTNEPCIIPNRGWGKSKEELERLQKENLIWYGDGTTPPRMKSYLSSDSESVFDNFFFVRN